MTLALSEPIGKPGRRRELGVPHHLLSKQGQRRAAARRRRMNAFLVAFSITRSSNAACAQVSISPHTIRTWREEDKEFNEAYELTEAQFVGEIEQELYKRAVVGEDKEVASAGHMVTLHKVKSDALLALMVKGKVPGFNEDKRRTIGAEMGVDKDGNKFFKVYEGVDTDKV